MNILKKAILKFCTANQVFKHMVIGLMFYFILIFLTVSQKF